MRSVIITIDGPAGSGKSSVARSLAQRLGLEFLDTGAMYRAITAAALDRGLDPVATPDAVIALAGRVVLRFDWRADPPTLYADEHDMTQRVRDADVTASVSDVAQLPGVRAVLVEQQKQIGAAHPRLGAAGRDQGAVVCPDAAVKFFLIASARVRAQRRADQLREAGREVDEQAIYENILDRDHKDASRADGPLTRPDDAIELDSSDMSLDQVLDELERLARQRLGDRLAVGPKDGR